MEKEIKEGDEMKKMKWGRLWRERRNSNLHACFACDYGWLLEGEVSVLQRSFYKIGRKMSMQCEILVNIESRIKHYAD